MLLIRSSLILLAFHLTVSQIAYADDRLPVPSAEQQKPVSEVVREIYGDHYAEAKSSSQREAFAKEIFDIAKDSTDSTEQYVLLRVARDAATQNYSVKLAIEIIDAMAVQFDIDGQSMQLDALTQIAQKCPHATQAKEAANLLLPMIEAMIDADKFTSIQKPLAALETAAQRSRDSKLLATHRERKQQADTLAKAYTQVIAAQDVLKLTPDNADANQTVGEYFCFLKNNWTKGLPHLAKGNDPTLREIAKLDLDGPAAADEFIELGDRWWDYADTTEEFAKSSVRLRAVAAYRQAVNGTTGLTQARILHRIKQIDPNYETLGDALADAWGELPEEESQGETVSDVPAPQDGGVDCSAWGDSSKEVVCDVLGGGLHKIYSVAFSSDGNTLAAGNKGVVTVWDVATRTQKPTIHVSPGSEVDDIAFSPDNKKIVVGHHRHNLGPFF